MIVTAAGGVKELVAQILVFQALISDGGDPPAGLHVPLPAPPPGTSRAAVRRRIPAGGRARPARGGTGRTRPAPRAGQGGGCRCTPPEVPGAGLGPGGRLRRNGARQAGRCRRMPPSAAAQQRPRRALPHRCRTGARRSRHGAGAPGPDRRAIPAARGRADRALRRTRGAFRLRGRVSLRGAGRRPVRVG